MPIPSGSLAQDPPPPLPDGTLRSLLAAHLTRTPGTVLVAGARADELAAALAVHGLRVEVDRGSGEGDPAGGLSPAPYGAAVLVHALCGRRPALDAQLARLRQLLASDGALVVIEGLAGDLAAEGAGLRSADLVAALSEAGFQLRRAGPLAEATEVPNAAVRGWSGAHRRLDAGVAEELVVARRDEVRVRDYAAGDEAQILALFPRVFHSVCSPALWDWRYRRNPFGSLRISVAVDGAGRLLAQYAGYPVRLRDFAAAARGGGELWANHIGDTMSDPGARHLGRGETSVLARTVRHFYARHCRGRVAFNYGFNTGNHQKFSLRYVHARRVEEVTVFARSLATPIAGRGPWRRRLGGWASEQVTEVDHRFDALLERVGPAYGVLVARDARYLRWRYLECPEAGHRLQAVTRRGRLVAWGAFRRAGDTLLWGDALVDPEATGATAELLAAAVADAAASPPAAPGAARPPHRIQAWFSPRPSWWIEELGRLGFVPEPEPNALALMAVPFVAARPEHDLYPRLYYTHGDSDLF
jgi:hypothetical protein